MERTLIRLGIVAGLAEDQHKQKWDIKDAPQIINNIGQCMVGLLATVIISIEYLV